MAEQEQKAVNPWADAEVIHAYTRADALADGFLVDISSIARQAGFTFAVAVTRGVWGILEPSKELQAEGQDWTGRTWDMLTILRYAIRGSSKTDEVHFAPLFIRKPRQRPEPVEMKATCGPGDAGEATITILLRSED